MSQSSAAKARTVELSDEQRIAFLQELRDARSLVLRDAESFHPATLVLERLGQTATKEVKTGLSQYRKVVVDLANQSGLMERDEICRLFDTIRTARNDAVHEGAFARHACEKLIDLILLLEEAIMATLKAAGDVMVRNPTVAEPWHNIARIRQEMLANSFSYIPVEIKGAWHVISDVAIAKYVGDASGTRKRELLSKELKDIVGNGLALEEPGRCDLEKPLSDVRESISHRPTLIFEKIDDKKRLVGILTAFDLL